jgi:hypothetical protein
LEQNHSVLNDSVGHDERESAFQAVGIGPETGQVWLLPQARDISSMRYQEHSSAC